MNVEGPRFKTQLFAESPQVIGLVANMPAVRRALFETGIPKASLGGRYRRTHGTQGPQHPGRAETPKGAGVATNLVNTTVELFSRTVWALFERFPYYSKGAEWAEIDSVCAELRDIIRSIDAEAAVPGYWPAYVDDEQMVISIPKMSRRNAI